MECPLPLVATNCLCWPSGRVNSTLALITGTPFVVTVWNGT
jgi:hypothetical protein